MAIFLTWIVCYIISECLVEILLYSITRIFILLILLRLFLSKGQVDTFFKYSFSLQRWKLYFHVQTTHIFKWLDSEAFIKSCRNADLLYLCMILAILYIFTIFHQKISTPPIFPTQQYLRFFTFTLRNYINR